MPFELSNRTRIGVDPLSPEGRGQADTAERGTETDAAAVAEPRGSSGESSGPGSVDVRDDAVREFAAVALETPENGLDVQGRRAADVLHALADLVSASTGPAAEKGQGFTGLARKLVELEARLQNLGRTNDAVAVKRAMGQIAAQLEGSALVRPGEASPVAEAGERRAEPGRDLVETGLAFQEVDVSNLPSSHEQTDERGATREQCDVSDEPIRETGRKQIETGRSSILEIDARIRDLTIHMAAAHRDALRSSALETGGGGIVPTATSLAGPSASKGPEVALGPGAEGAPTARPLDEASSDTRSGLSRLLRRLETKLDTLAHKAEAEKSSAADRHQTDLLARRIESAELQLAKRLDAGFAAVAAEMRAVEDMLRASVARWEAQGDLGGALARLERSIDSVRERLDRLEKRVPSGAGAENKIDHDDDRATTALAVTSRTEADAPQTEPRAARAPDACGDLQSSAREPSIPCPARGESARTAAPADPTRDAIARIAERLRYVEAHLSNKCAGFADVSAGAVAGSPTLPWFGGRKKHRRDTGNERTACPEAAFVHGDMVPRADPDPGTDTDVLIEPGSGFTPPLDAHATRTSLDPGLDSDEGGSDRTDFIEAARRATRAAQGIVEPPPIEEARVPRRARDVLGAEARRIAQIVKSAILPG